MPSLLEEDLEPHYSAWKQAPGPATNAALLRALQPTIEGAVHTHVGASHPLLLGRARRLALEGLAGYDPARGKLRTYTYNHLRGLKRVAAQQGQALAVPQRLALEHAHLRASGDELAHELGREPTDDELADRSGLSHRRLARLRSYHPGVAEGTLAAALPDAAGTPGGLGPVAAQHDAWRQLVYDGLDAHHKKVMEWALGLHGQPVLPGHEIARRLGRSPGAVSQAKLRIQRQLDDEAELSPF